MRQLVDVEHSPALVVLGQLKLIKAEWEIIQERGCFFHADHSTVKGLDVSADSRISPHAGSHHKSDRLAGTRIDTPEMDKEWQAVQRLQQHRGKRGSQNDPGCDGHAPYLSCCLQPLSFRASAPDRLEHRLKIGVTIEDQTVHERRKTCVWYVAEAPDTLLLRDQIVVQVFHVGDILDKCPGVLAVYCDAGACQIRHLVGAGQDGLADDEMSPDSALPVCQLQFLFSRINIHQSLHRHNRVRAGYLIIETVLFVNPEVIGFPFAGVKLQRLIGKLGNVFDVEGAALSLQALHVFFVHGLEAPEAF